MPLRDRLKPFRRRGGQPPAEPPAPEPTVSDCELKDLLKDVHERQLAVQEALGEGELHHAQRRETARRLVLGRVFDHLDGIARLLRLNGSNLDPCIIVSLGELLKRVDSLLQAPASQHPAFLTIRRRFSFYHPAYREAGWELVSELECVLLEVGDHQYLASCLEDERNRDGNANGDTLRWSDIHEVETLIDLQRQLGSDTALTSTSRNEAIELLARLYQARSDADREHRAQENLRVVRLRWTCRILMVAIVVVAGLVAARLGEDWPERLLLVALGITPAVLGGTLGSVRSLRTEELSSRSGEQPRYRWAFIAQLLVSSTFGVLILVLAGLEVLPGVQIQPPDESLLDDPGNYYALITYSFLAGFSEPFTLNFIERFLTPGVM
jgi:hypothetical protein